MSKGAIKFADVSIPIVDIQIRNGNFIAIGRGWGPTPEYWGPMTVIGEDGVILVIGGELSCPESKKGQPIDIELVLSPGSPIAM